MADESKGTEEILEQLRELGQLLEKTIRKALESREGQEIQKQVSKGVKELSEHLGKAFESAQADQAVKGVQEQVKRALDSTGADEAAEKLRRRLGEGLRALNEQLNTLLKDVSKGSKD